MDDALTLLVKSVVTTGPLGIVFVVLGIYITRSYFKFKRDALDHPPPPSDSQVGEHRENLIRLDGIRDIVRDTHGNTERIAESLRVVAENQARTATILDRIEYRLPQERGSHRG